ncbi:MAG TPA: MFS transporter [Puia sp.]|nr:MFS transporter [Puia sp.]
MKRRIIGYVVFTFFGYFTIGLALAILPIFVHQDLGYGTMIAGIVISTQYVTTFFFRGYGGGLVDKKGPKPVIMLSMVGFAISGTLLAGVHFLGGAPFLSLVALTFTRLITGIAEGLLGASPITWGILATSEGQTARVISFNGIASYGSLALGAPLGVIIHRHFGLAGIGVVTTAVGLLGLLYARNKPDLKIQSHAPRQPFARVLRQVTPYGICLGLGGIGFGSISTFITLYYAFLNWQGAVLGLSVFSVLFITGRLVFPNAINRWGGLRTSLVCLSVETLGLLLLWWADTPQMAVAGAGLAGLGFSLVFPALGVETVKLVPASNKGSALGAYGLFLDLSLGVTGPLIGAFAGRFGMRHIYLFAMSLVFCGLIIVLALYRRRK